MCLMDSQVLIDAMSEYLLLPVDSRSIETLFGVINAEIAVRDLKSRNRYEVKLYKDNSLGTVQYDPTKAKPPRVLAAVVVVVEAVERMRTKVAAKPGVAMAVENLVAEKELAATKVVARPIRPKKTHGKLIGMLQVLSMAAVGSIQRDS